MAKHKLTPKEVKKCLTCEWRDKNTDGTIMCPRISCIKERVENSKLRNVRHKQA